MPLSKERHSEKRNKKALTHEERQSSMRNARKKRKERPGPVLFRLNADLGKKA